VSYVFESVCVCVCVHSRDLCVRVLGVICVRVCVCYGGACVGAGKRGWHDLAAEPSTKSTAGTCV